MKLIFLPAMLCTILVLASAVPINKSKLKESDSNPNSNDFIVEHDLNNLPDPITDDGRTNGRHGGGDVEAEVNEIPDKDRKADEDKNGPIDDNVESFEDVPVDDREADDGKDSNADDTDQHLNDLPKDDDRNNATTTSQKISTTVRVVTPQGDIEKDNNTMQDTIPGTEKQVTSEENPPRKRYVKQSTGEYRHRPVQKSRKTVTIPVSKKAKSGTTPKKGDDTKKVKSNQGRDPPGRKNPSSPSPTSSKPDRKTTTGNPSADPRIKTRSTRAPSRVPNDDVNEENTCPCRIVAKPKMKCYRFTTSGKGACKLRMCGAQWKCLKNGTSSNICIRKFATEKITMIPGTQRCISVRHPPKAYWVFYRKYTGPRGNQGKRVGQA